LHVLYLHLGRTRAMLIFPASCLFPVPHWLLLCDVLFMHFLRFGANPEIRSEAASQLQLMPPAESQGEHETATL
jgi:hypothetical protein